jgi:hypothetical protein
MGAKSVLLMAKKPEHEVDQSSPSYIKIKNEWIYSFTPPYSFIACTGTNFPLL